jgi:methionyl-tRNA synthetase
MGFVSCFFNFQGTPVPLESHKDKVFYVWFDAPIGYISITANYTKDWEQWWKNPKNVEFVQFMGKDNVPFHSIIFPGSLLGTGEDWTLVNKLSSTAYLNYEEGKFSKSRGTGIFGNDAKDTGILPEVFRYYLLVNRPETGDSEFNWLDFGEKNNTELLNNLGNFVYRALTYVSGVSQKKEKVVHGVMKKKDKNPFEGVFDGKVPKSNIGDAEKAVIQSIDALLVEYVNALENIKIKEGLKIALKISTIGNIYFQEQKPWEVVKENVERCGAIVNLGIQISYLLATILQPFIPGFTDKFLQQLNFKPKDGINIISDKFDYNFIPEGHFIGETTPIFKSLLPTDLEIFREKFGAKTFEANLIVGKILSVSNVEDSDTLYKLDVDVGEKKTKQVLAGIRKIYESKDLVDLNVIVVTNLKVTKIKNETSEGMLLTACDKKRTKVVLLSAPKDSKPGDSIFPKEYPQIQTQNILTKTLLDKLLKKLKIEDDGKISYKQHNLVIKNDDNESIVVDTKKIEKGFEIH